MALYNITREQQQKIIAQLDQAIHNHVQWHSAFIRTLACRLPCNKHDLNPDAYKECLFGQWYYDYPDEELRGHPGFIAIGEQHKRMHELSIVLLTASSSGNPILPNEYDNFANALERLRLEVFSLRSEIENYLYNRDSLTGAISRVNIMPILREQQDLVKRQSESCCIVMVDIDQFKEVNDHHGHAAGDKVLATITHYMIEHLRTYDRIFRYGGEEFLICIPHTQLEAGLSTIEKLGKEIAALSIDIGNAEKLNISLSFGLTLLDANVPVEQSIERADKALYAAKAAGRNCTKVWEPGMQF